MSIPPCIHELFHIHGADCPLPGFCELKVCRQLSWVVRVQQSEPMNLASLRIRCQFTQQVSFPFISTDTGSSCF